DRLISLLQDISSPIARKVLLVDDDEIMRESVRRVLEQERWQVEGASNGRFALQHLAESCPDVIVLDLMMREMDWVELLAATRQLKAAQHTRHIPVIALNANAMSGDREKALAAGCDDFDTKPIVMPRLLEKIRALSGAHKPDDRMSKTVTPGTDA